MTDQDLNPVDVVIIGAGLAGLATAVKLKDAGLTVRVLEARERSGGRVLTIQDQTVGPIDLGAQFVGSDHHRVRALAGKAGLTLVDAVPKNVPMRLVDSSGAEVKAGIADWLGQLSVLVRLNADAWAPGSRPAALDTVTAARFLRSWCLSGRAYTRLAALLEAELCMGLDKISAYDLLAQLQSIGGIQAGASTDAEAIAEGADGLVAYLGGQLEDAIVYAAPVDAVRTTRDEVQVRAGGRLHRARAVVIAIPPQCTAQIAFDPPLPAHRQGALDAFVLGRIEKTVLVYDHPWWLDRKDGATILSSSARFDAVTPLAPREDGRALIVGFSSRPRDHDGPSAEQALAAWLASVYGPGLPEPCAAAAMDWTSQAFSLGGYASHRAPGRWTTAPDLFDPLDRLVFAGTETAREWRSFMEGALCSAEAAAHAALARLTA